MKIEKNKIVFASVLAFVLLFLVAYTLLVLREDSGEQGTVPQVRVPDLPTGTKEYERKIDALNDLEEAREATAPSVYNEKWIDTLGYYDTVLPEKEKKRMIDSIYELGRFRRAQVTGNDDPLPLEAAVTTKTETGTDIGKKASDSTVATSISLQERGLAHQLFFAADPLPEDGHVPEPDMKGLQVVVEGDQVVKADHRLRMRTVGEFWVQGIPIPQNTIVFGQVRFRPNRLLLKIDHLGRHNIALRAYDLEDGNEGIYVENSFRAEATGEVVDDLVQDINIAGVPQVSGIKQVFRRNNRNVKVTVLDNYGLILKPIP
jgi:hypothetical protein